MSKPIKADPIDEQEELALIKRVKLSPTREWINAYFDIMACLIEALGLENGDPRLVTSIPSQKYSVPMFLPVSTNNRYALAPSLGRDYNNSHVVVDSDFLAQARDDYLVGIIYGPEFRSLPNEYKRARAVFFGHFDPLVYETTPPPLFVRIKHPQDLLTPGPLQDGWINAALSEVDRSKGSPYQKSHRPVVYEAAVNREFRKKILDKAFSDR